MGDAGDGVRPDSDGPQPLRKPGSRDEVARSETSRNVALPGGTQGTGNGSQTDPAVTHAGSDPLSGATTATGNGADFTPLVLQLAPRTDPVVEPAPTPGDGPAASDLREPTSPYPSASEHQLPTEGDDVEHTATDGNGHADPAEAGRAIEVDTARRRATPAVVGEWRPPVQRAHAQRALAASMSDAPLAEAAGTNGVRYGAEASLTAMATLTIIDTSEPLVEGPTTTDVQRADTNGSNGAPGTHAAAANGAAANGEAAASANGAAAAANGVAAANGAAAAALTIASPSTSNGRLWRQIERSPWDAPVGEPTDARSQLRLTIRPGTDGYPPDSIENYPVRRRLRRRRRRMAIAVILLVALIGAVVVWTVASGSSDPAGGTSADTVAATPTTPAPGSAQSDGRSDSVVVPTPTAPVIDRNTGAQGGTAADAAVGAEPPASESAPEGAQDLETTPPDGAAADGQTAPVDDAPVAGEADDVDPNADSNVDEETPADTNTTAPDAGPAAPPALGFATIGNEEGQILNACTSFPFDPVTADYQLFSFLVRTDTDRWIVDRWFDVDIDGIFLHQLSSGVVSTGSAVDGPTLIEGSADGIAVSINPPAEAFDECVFVVRTSPTDVEDAPYTQAILDSCVVNDGAVNRFVASLTEGGRVDITDRGDGTAEIRYADDDLDVALVEPNGRRAIDGTIATWSGTVTGDADAQRIEVRADTAGLPSCAADQL